MYPFFLFFNQGVSSGESMISFQFYFFVLLIFWSGIWYKWHFKKEAKLQRNKGGLICLDIPTIVESYFSHGDGSKGLYVEEYYFFFNMRPTRCEAMIEATLKPCSNCNFGHLNNIYMVSCNFYLSITFLVNCALTNNNNS